MKKRKNKRERELDAMTRDILRRVTRIKTRADLRDPDGRVRVFRSTVAEEAEENGEEEEEAP